MGTVMMAWVPAPSALRSTIRARQTCFCEVLRSATRARSRCRPASPRMIVIPLRMRQTSTGPRQTESTTGLFRLGQSTRHASSVFMIDGLYSNLEEDQGLRSRVLTRPGCFINDGIDSSHASCEGKALTCR